MSKNAVAHHIDERKNFLTQLLKSSEALVNKTDEKYVQNQVKEIEEKVYLFQLSTSRKDYLQKLWENINAEQTEKSMVINGIHEKNKIVFEELLNNLLNLNPTINKTKFNIEEIQKATQIKTMVSRKQELEEKLKYLDLNINILKTYDTMSVQNDLNNTNSNSMRLKSNEDFTEQKRKQEAAKDFARRMEQKRKEVEKLRSELRTVSEEKLKKVEEGERQAKLEENLRLKEEKFQKIQENIKLIEKRKADRQELESKFTEFLQEYKAKKPLFKVFEEQYENNLVLPELEEKKQRLKDIRNLHKPNYHEDVEKHKSKYDEERMTKEKDRQERMAKLLPTDQKQFFKGKIYQQVQEEDEKNLVLLKPTDQKKEKMIVVDKVKSFIDKVKRDHAPTIDEKKALELQELKEKIAPVEHNKYIKKKIKREDHYEYQIISIENTDPRKFGAQYLESAGKVPLDKSKLENPNPEINESKASVNMSIDLGNNYLKELREKNKNLQINKIEAWKKELESKDLTKIEKYERALDMANQLEEGAKRKEKLLRVQDKKDAVEVQNGINEHYINSIRAKIAVLQDL